MIFGVRLGCDLFQLLPFVIATSSQNVFVEGCNIRKWTKGVRFDTKALERATVDTTNSFGIGRSEITDLCKPLFPRKHLLGSLQDHSQTNRCLGESS